MMATVRAPGSRLATRPSITPADASAMATMRRQVSGQENTPPALGHEAFNNQESLDMFDQDQKTDASSASSLNESGKRVSGLVQLDLPQVHNDEGLGFGLEQEFDRVVKAQKRGYLMRQNTKVVVASNRADEDTKPAPLQPTSLQPAPLQPMPRKISQQAWVSEPWNGKSRRRSLRTAGEANVRKKGTSGVVPPLPGQPSAVNDSLDAVNENENADEEVVDFDENAERGCLFVKVVGVKDLDLPLSSDEQSFFALTLDNGLHCVTTSWLQLGKTASIDQEFELVVLDDLEFQLTLQMKLEQPKPQTVEAPAKTPPSPVKKQGAFSRLFGSPRKHKDVQALRPASPVKQQPPSMYDRVQGIVGQDGSFARAYVALSEHEKQAFGRPYPVDITCFNEWAMEEVPLTVGSSRSKKSVNTLQRRVPYQIGKLELQLLYIPKPKGTKEEDMPKSMNGALRELRDAETRSANVFEGHLSQQGGDCPYWRRRLFKLVGSKLTAYHETTNQPRATINLAKATRIVDDKSALTKKETSTKGGGRRKSAFAEEEEGYMFVEEGFRIRFGNGEVIDFYADSAAAKAEWMKALSEVIGKAGLSSQSKPWVDAIIKRERSLAVKEGRHTKTPARPETGPKKISKDHQVQEPMSPAAMTKQRQEQMSPVPMAKHDEASRPVVEDPNRTPTGGRSFDNRGSGIPVPSGGKSRSQSPVKDSRYYPSPEDARRQQPAQSQYHHVRTDSGYQQRQPQPPPPPPPSSSASFDFVPGSRSQPASPVKEKTGREARYQKARSVIGMQWH